MKLGNQGETCAAEYLKNKGYRIVERNFRCSFGEIDIIAIKDKTLCFIEVKTRQSAEFGSPCMAVDRRKLLHIKRCAYVFMGKCRISYSDIRVEIIELIYNEEKFYVRHLEKIDMTGI